MDVVLRLLGVLLVGVGEWAEVLLAIGVGVYGHKERSSRCLHPLDPTFNS